MVVPFTATAPWLLQISKLYPREPLQKGLGEGGLWGFCLVNDAAEKKKFYSQQIYFIILHPSRLFHHQNNRVALSPWPALLSPPIRSLLSCFCMFLVLVVDKWKILKQQPSKVNVHFSLAFCCWSIWWSKQWDGVPPRAPPPPLSPPL